MQVENHKSIYMFKNKDWDPGYVTNTKNSRTIQNFVALILVFIMISYYLINKFYINK